MSLKRKADEVDEKSGSDTSTSEDDGSKYKPDSCHPFTWEWVQSHILTPLDSAAKGDFYKIVLLCKFLHAARLSGSTFEEDSKYCPKLRTYANTVCDVDLDSAKSRRVGGLSGTNVRNQFYYELMRVGPHSVVGTNKPAPGYIIAGCEAAFPWGKPGLYIHRKSMPADHASAYTTDHGLSDGELQRIMDLIAENVDPVVATVPPNRHPRNPAT